MDPARQNASPKPCRTSRQNESWSLIGHDRDWESRRGRSLPYVFVEEPGTGPPFRESTCATLALVIEESMSTPRVPPYEPIAEEWAFWRETVSPADLNEPQLSSVPPGARYALDAGCGHGLLTFPVAERAGFAVGMDLAFSMVVLARERLRQQAATNVSFLVGDVVAPPFRPGVFDFVLSVNVLHHSDLERSLPQLRALLAAGGRIAVADVIARHPGLDDLPFFKLLRALRWAPANARKHGVRKAWRILRFHLGADWLRRNPRPRQSLAQFRALYSRHFPGCTFKQNRNWCAGMNWEAPPPET